MNVYRLEEMRWPEVEALDKERTLIFLPVSPIEEHGPHLPLGTDLFGARDIAEKAASLVVEADPSLEVVLAPAIPLGCSGVTGDFPGTVSLGGETLRRVVADVCSSLAAQGFRYIVISNHHLDPVHVKAILDAIEEVCGRYDVQIVETLARIVYSGLETEEARAGRAMGLDMNREVHADVKETSFIRYRYPKLVQEEAKDLPPVLIGVEKGFREGLKTFKAMGADEGYIGSPAMATEDLGRLHLEEGAGLTADLALKLHRGEVLPEISDQMKNFFRNRVRLD
ncbi:MAG: creatininase family protein [Desulfatiglandales bacterium]